MHERPVPQHRSPRTEQAIDALRDALAAAKTGAPPPHALPMPIQTSRTRKGYVVQDAARRARLAARRAHAAIRAAAEVLAETGDPKQNGIIVGAIFTLVKEYIDDHGNAYMVADTHYPLGRIPRGIEMDILMNHMAAVARDTNVP